MSLTDSTLNYYNERATEFAEGTQHVNFSALQKEFASYICKGGRLLDLGCGSGRDSKAFMNMGYEVVAIDGSHELCKIASAYIGHKVTCSTFQEYQPEGKFDGIWACASLLHLPITEVNVVIKNYAATLNEGGVFYVSFKYGDYSGERNGRFFTDMTEKLFAELLENIPELKIDKQYVTEDVRPGRSAEKWLNIFMLKQS